MAEGNAYGNIINMMKDVGYNKDVKIYIGKVKTLSPLVFSLNGYDIEPGDYFLTETVSNLLGNVTGYTTVTHLSTGMDVEVDEERTVYPVTEAATGDRFLILVDENDFYVIDRVVG